MAIPDYQTILLPMLKLLEDGREHFLNVVLESLVELFQLTLEETKQLLPSGAPIFYNRVGWSGTYLRKAGLIDVPRRGYYQITNEGKQLLNTNPARLDYEMLRKLQKNSPLTSNIKQHTSRPQKEVKPRQSSQKNRAVMGGKLAETQAHRVKLSNGDVLENRPAAQPGKKTLGKISKEKDSVQLVRRKLSDSSAVDVSVMLHQHGTNGIFANTRKFDQTVGSVSDDDNSFDTKLVVNSSPILRYPHEVHAMETQTNLQVEISNHVPVDDGEDWSQELWEPTE